MQDSKKQQLTEIASYEEMVSCIRQALFTGIKEGTELYSTLQRVSQGCEKWRCCLIMTEADMLPEVRSKAASMLLHQKSMYLVDLEINSLCIVYGCSASLEDDQKTLQLFTSLLEECASKRIWMAAGAGEDSLLHISMSYESACEAIKYLFYSEGSGLIRYEEIMEQSFSYHYDQLQVMDELMQPVLLLDLAEFREAVQAAASGFRKLLLAPELAKKVVIHVLHRILEMVEEGTGEAVEHLLKSYTVPELTGSVINLRDLMDTLQCCGEESIQRLIQEQDKQSQGIIQEIMKYIEEHYRERLTLKQLSELFYIHPVYLGQLLLKRNGITFNKLIHNLRIEEAKRLLIKNELKNSEIAERLGYSHYSQFLKQFEIRMNMSPNEFKNTNIKSF